MLESRLATRIASRAATPSRLLLTLAREVVNFVCVYVKHDLPASCVRVLDDHLSRFVLVDFVAAYV